MLRIVLVLLFLNLICFSCKERNQNAKKLCDCYTNLHVAKSPTNVDFWSDSCENLYLNILQDLALNEDEMRAFQTDYKKCQ
jgi:hypothetical protein